MCLPTLGKQQNETKELHRKHKMSLRIRRVPRVQHGEKCGLHDQLFTC